MNGTDWTILAVGLVQWAIGCTTGWLFSEARATRRLMAVEAERDAMWDELNGARPADASSVRADSCVYCGAKAYRDLDGSIAAWVSKLGYSGARGHEHETIKGDL